MSPIRNIVRGQRGQISIPSLFVLPSLFLFVYLIFETAKLSREKIRHQFALDSAAFIEMTNYSDFLNRSAYVNGAFPQRIFYEGFYNTCIEKKNNSSGDCGAAGERLYEILYQNGAFPRSQGTAPDQALDNVERWDIAFGGTGAGKNSNPPSVPSQLELITMQNALDYWLSWDDAQDIYKLYVQIYQLLGSVEDAQWSVFKRLTSTHNFFRKSYWLNTNDPINDAYEGASWFSRHSFNPTPYCVEEIMIYGNKPTNNAFQPYQIWAPNSPISMPNTISGCSPAGLFQVMAIPDSDLSALRSPRNSPGYQVFQSWRAPGNYFNVPFGTATGLCRSPGPSSGPCVHATIGAVNTTPVGGLWPNPTPKFQSRLSP